MTLPELARIWFERSPLQHAIIVRNIRNQQQEAANSKEN